jgi:uncharacterized membrane protein YdbT with pleckstrin-like domain
MMTLNDQERRGFLKDEYLFLQSQYEDFDRRSLTIKGWIASGAVAALAISFGSSYEYDYLVPILVAIMAAIFWYLEAYWKLFQYAIGDRIRVIEAYFRDESEILEKDPVPFQTYHRFYLSFARDEPLYDYEREEKGRPRRRSRRLRQFAVQSFVFLPYLAIIVLSLASFVMLLLTDH